MMTRANDYKKLCLYRAGDARGQYEAKSVFWLATRAGKMNPSLLAQDYPLWSRIRNKFLGVEMQSSYIDNVGG